MYGLGPYNYLSNISRILKYHQNCHLLLKVNDVCNCWFNIISKNAIGDFFVNLMTKQVCVARRLIYRMFFQMLIYPNAMNNDPLMSYLIHIRQNTLYFSLVLYHKVCMKPDLRIFVLHLCMITFIKSSHFDVWTLMSLFYTTWY